jgi:uncharacterized phage protein (TIGR02218 family)
MRLLLLCCLFMHVPQNIQTPYTATDFWNNFESATPRMTVCILVTPVAGDPIGFTSNTRDMTLPGHPGVTFKSSPGITPSSIESALDEPSTLEMMGIYQEGSFTHEQIVGGYWNFARVQIFTVSWNNPNLGELILFTGNLGDFKDYQTYFNAEARGTLSRLSNDTAEVTTRTGRCGPLGSPRCRVDLDGVRTIDGVDYNITETNLTSNATTGPGDTSAMYADFSGPVPPNNFYANGKITVLTGLNAGVSREIAANIRNDFDGVMSFILKRGFPLNDPDPVLIRIQAGCRLTVEDCMSYNNIINMDAEPYIPGIESLRKLPQ